MPAIEAVQPTDVPNIEIRSDDNVDQVGPVDWSKPFWIGPTRVLACRLLDKTTIRLLVVELNVDLIVEGFERKVKPG